MLYLTKCFLCALSPLTKTLLHLFPTIIYPLPPLLNFSLLLFVFLSILFILPLLFAALLPISAASHPARWLCYPGPAMTVSFTRVSPVSSFSLCRPPAPTAGTRAQPQHRPSEKRHDNVKVGQRGPRPVSGEIFLNLMLLTPLINK